MIFFFINGTFDLMEKERENRKIINIDLDEDEGGETVHKSLDGDEDEDEDDGDDDVNDINNCNSGNTNIKSEIISSSKSCKKSKHKITRAVKEILTNSNTKFMSNFDPELSNRERRKLTRKFNSEGKKNSSVYDENGFLSGLEKDVCDCLVEDCPGCHFPCPKCRSCKCGVECRVNRKWMCEAIENEAEATVTKNAYIYSS